MAMRDLVSGGAACSVPGASSSSNPLGTLANAILGQSSKAQELKGLPGSTVNTPSTSSEFQRAICLTTIPGSEYENEHYRQADERSSEFLGRFRAADNGQLADAWSEIHQPPVLHQGRQSEISLADFEQIYNRSANSHLPPTLDGPPQIVLSRFLHSFVGSGLAGVPFHPASLPALGLSESDKQCICDRSCIMARHMFADKSENYISAQVNALLQSLGIDSYQRLRGPTCGPFPELEEYWNESQGGMRGGMPSLHDSWASEFSQQTQHGDPEAWARSFEQMHVTNGWASEFDQEQSQLVSTGQMAGGNMSKYAAMEQSRMLAHTLSQNVDPKFQNSKFLQFVSKMSRGELIVDENQIKPADGSLTSNWVDEYQKQCHDGPSSWADQFVREELPQGTETWMKEYTKENQGVDEEWVSQFSQMHVQDWAEEFGKQVAEGIMGEISVDAWADAYEKFMDEQQLALKQQANAGVYVFSDMNPYGGHPNPLKEGQELFRRGLLSEAVLALEAEVVKNPDSVEGWRLLGITHAENDDDQQAIAAMMRAQEVDPTNLEILLALGVSHTNELEQAEALKDLHRWIQNHPKYGALAPPGPSDSLYFGDVARLFNEAAAMSPEDADVHIVLGVLYNLSREYDKAVESFKRALELKPRDYSLWNKLGATQERSIQRADAILAYQQALDLKPNYVRAWTNMGTGYASQGLHEESIPFYVRALSMNPKVDNAWRSLRISLRCASRNDMLEACDSRNLDILQKEFPL